MSRKNELETRCRINAPRGTICVSCDYIMLGEDTNIRGKEKLICVLEKIEPKQTCRIHNILKILYEMCDVL